MEGRQMSSEDEKRRRKQQPSSGGRDWRWFPGDLFNGFAVSDASLAMVLIILLLAGVAVLVYFIAIVLANFLSFGEVHKASVYCKKVRRYSIDEPRGCGLASQLTRMNIYFSVLLFFFTAEEAIRYVLHTGTATLEIWYFRFACLAIFAVILAVFLVRLRRWMIFTSNAEFSEAEYQIKKRESDLGAMYRK
jgi:hypothetical protein